MSHFNKNKSIYIGVTVVSSILIIECIMIIALQKSILEYSKINYENPNKDIIGILGASGDFIAGYINPVLTAITIAALFYANSMQKSEAKDSKATIALQINDVRKQAFENTFFKMLEKLDQITHEILISEREKTISISNNYDGQQNILVNHVKDYLKTVSQQKLNLRFAKLRLDLYNKYHSKYFLFLYQILKIIFTSTNDIKSNENLLDSIQNKPITPLEKMYANILRSSISEDLLLMLAINCYTKDRNDQYFRYKSYLERYAFFEHYKSHYLPGDLKIIDIDIFSNYSQRAFGDNSCYKKLKSQ